MSHAGRLKRSPPGFRLLTGLTPEKFDALPAELTPRYEQAQARRHARPGRRRKPGAGRKFSSALGDRLLMLLIYGRTYVTHAFLALPVRHRRFERVSQRRPLAAAAGRRLPHPRAEGWAGPG